MKILFLTAILGFSSCANAQDNCAGLSMSEKIKQGCDTSVSFKLEAPKRDKTCEEMTVKEKISASCNLDEKFFTGKTALMQAVQAGNKEDVKLLLLKGADANLRDDSGSTALMMAIADGKSSIFNILIAANANVTTKNSMGSTALSISRLAAEKEMEVIVMSRLPIDFCDYSYKQISEYFFITKNMDDNSSGTSFANFKKEIANLSTESNYNSRCNVDDSNSNDSGGANGAS